jgi:predicted dehydrogenase
MDMAQAESEMPKKFSLCGVSKRFGGIRACQDISFDIFPGDVIAIAGENGAGKSTVSKCLYGLYSPTEGHIEIDGVKATFASPADGEAAGIVMIPQELDLFPELSISDNVCVGAGRDSVIGGTHLVAARVDGFYEIASGVFSSDSDVSRATAKAEFVDPDRVYDSYADMARSEAARDDGIDAVLIATPPHLHAPVAEAFLQNGIDVICEKPMTVSRQQALELDDLVRKTDRLFCLTHCYTGYPMVREARQMVRSGKLGKIRVLEAELAAGDPGVSVEPADPKKRHWRFKDDVMGKGAILGEVSSHAHHLLHYIFGEEISEVSAEMQIFTPRRIVYDNAYVTARYASGAVARIWGSYVAAGNDHGLRFRIFGEAGGLTWDQEDPEVLWFKPIGGKALRIARGYEDLSPGAAQATRFRPGHPEGYALAFANLYAEFGCAIMARKLGLPHGAFYDALPSTGDGIVTLSLIDAANMSQENNGHWTPVPSVHGSKA